MPRKAAATRVVAEAVARDLGSVSAAVARAFPEAGVQAARVVPEEAEVQAAQAVPGVGDPADLVLVVPAVEVVLQSMPVICGVRRDRRAVGAAVVQAEELPESGVAEEEAELVLEGEVEPVVEAVELVSAEVAEPVLEVAAVLQATLVAFPAQEVRRERRLENG